MNKQCFANCRALLFYDIKMKIDLANKTDDKICEIANYYIENFNPSEHKLSLFDGLGGVALLFFEKINSDLRTHEDEEFFLRIFDVIYDKLNSEDYSLTYCDGLAGIAFLIRICKTYLETNDYDVEELLIDIDRIILDSMSCDFEVVDDFNSLDFLHGKLGVLHYLITFNINPSSTKVIYNHIVVSIFKNLNKIKNTDNQSFNYGLAHGMCSYIHIVINGIDLAVDKTQAVSLLKLIGEIYLDADINFSNLSLYPSISSRNDFEKNASFLHPLGWCYGDQTISTSLHKLGQFLNSERILKHSYKVSDHWKKRNDIYTSLGNSEYYDFSFCHGMSSVAFFNKKWFDITNDIGFLENYKVFMDLIISQIQQDDTIAGFKKCTGDENLYKKDWGLLTGATGIGLNLMYQRNNRNNNWLKLFLYE